MNATYTPTADEIAAHSATVTLTTGEPITLIPSGPCTSVNASMTITIHPAATASAGANQTICAGSATAALGGTVGGGATGGTWSGGSGTFSPNATTLNATYQPSANDITVGSVTLTLSSTGQQSPCGALTAQVIVAINATPAIESQPANVTVNSGVPATFCVGATGASLSYQWEVSGNNGVTFTNISAIATNACYTNPATILADDAKQYRVVVTGSCSPGQTSTVAVLTVGLPYTVYAGPDQTICAGEATQLAGQYGNGATGAIWTSGGSFAPNSTTMNAIYTPSASEISAGSATLTLTTHPPGSVSSTMTITINPTAQVNAGPNQTVCSISPATQLAGSFGGGATLAYWSGAGLFLPNIYATNAIYTPTATEIAAGSATLSLFSNDPPGPCGVATNSMTITIHPTATASAGGNQTICAGSATAGLGGTVSGATGGTWSGGSGTFNPDATTLNATYQASTNDITSGTVTLTLTTTGQQSPCPAATAQVVVTIRAAATVNAGGNQTICASGSTVTLNGSYGGGATGATWSGAGSFAPNNTTMNAAYSPTETELAAGSATVTLTSSGQLLPCGAATASMTMTINAPPLITAQPQSMTNCAGSPATFTATATGTGLRYQWQVSTDGGTSFTDISSTATNASYDIAATTVAESGYQYHVIIDNAACIAITSAPPAVLTVHGLPAITSQPASLTKCASSAATFSVTATGTDLTYQWQVSADGGVTFTNISDTETNTSYTVAATTLAESGLKYHVIVSGACSPAQTSAPPAVLTVNAPATASAGANQTICSSGLTAGLGGTVGGGATGGTWSSPGAGTFTPNATTLNATYTPSAADKTAGTVTLTLTTTGQQTPCSAVTTQVVVTVLRAATAAAGGNQTICSTGETASLGGTVGGGATGGTWSSATGGTFTPNATTLSAIYTPSAADISAGTVTLTLTTTGQQTPCGAVTAQVVVTIRPAATVATGGNQQIYAGLRTAGLGGTYGGGATGGIWSSPGGGTFNPNATTLNATYTPSATDKTAGTVTLTLTATGQQAPCVATAQMVVTILTPTGTTLALVPASVSTPQAYGTTVLSATVVPSAATGSVTFYDNAIVLATNVAVSGGTATLATNLAVNGGVAHPIYAVFNDPTGQYTNSVSGISNVVITARAVTLGGGRTYDGTGTITPARGLSLVNNLDDGNLTLTPVSGIVNVAGRNVGTQSIISTLLTNGPTSTTNRAAIPANAPSYLITTNYSAPTRVRSGTGATATGTAGSFAVNMGTAPTNGNTLVAVISTRGTSAGRVTSISQTGATWSRATQAANANGSTTEIWYAPNVSGAAATLTINQAGLRSAAVVMEYSGLAAANLDQVSSGATGNSAAASTGATPATTQATEVWVGGIGLVDSGLTLTPTGAPLFTSRGSAQSASTTANLNAKAYFLDYTAEAIGTASAGGTISASSQWSGAIATFKRLITYTYYTTNSIALAGSAAPNYTLTLSGSVTVTTTNLALTAAANTKLYDGGINAAAQPTITAGNIQIGDTAPTWTETYDSKNVGAGKTLTPAGLVNDGNSGNNYSYNYIPAATGAINATNLTVTAAANTKPYDGGTTATAQPTITTGRIQTGDTAPIWTETYANRDVGTGKTLTPASLKVTDGNSGNNYNYTYTPVATGVISATALTITATPNTKTYDGGAAAAALATITAGTIQTGDTAPVWTESYDNRNVGTGKTLTPAALKMTDGNSGNNYSYTYTPIATGVISATNLTVTAVANTKTYDGTTSAAASPTITAGNIQTGDTAPTWTETYDNANPGTNKTMTPAGVVSDGNSGLNYSYTYTPENLGVIDLLGISQQPTNVVVCSG
ncbi:MAG: YDG domain-containing protein, partial [Verrucomicrobia bacterium]|nr:YDG domain-containing protein [Verrucomicrobiota bacterium]